MSPESKTHHFRSIVVEIQKNFRPFDFFAYLKKKEEKKREGLYVGLTLIIKNSFEYLKKNLLSSSTMLCHDSISQSDAVSSFLQIIPWKKAKTSTIPLKQEQKRVHFPNNPVQSVLMFENAEARNNPNVIWYSMNEIQFIKQRNLESIRRCRTCGPMDETEWETYLGLDVLAERKKARWKRNQIYQAVFLEQSRQLIENQQQIPELLAETYRQKMDQVNALLPPKRMFAQSA